MTVATKGRPQVAAEAETVPRRCVGLLGQGHLIPQAASDRPAQAILLLRCKSASLGFAARGGCSCNGSSATSSGIRSTGTSNPPSSLQTRFARLCREGGTQTFFVSGQLPIPLHLTHCSYSVQLFLNFVPFCIPIIHPYPSKCKSKKADRKKLRSARRVCVIPSFFSASFPAAHRPLTGAAPSASPPRG